MTSDPECADLSRRQEIVKRGFDLALSTIGLALTWWLMLLAYVVATLDTGKNGLFLQKRIGRYGKPFRIIKIRTMRDMPGEETNVTTAADRRITTIGRLLRKTKQDELPQLINVLLGDMSFVGPRPDVPGFADRLEGDDRVVLSVRPGITGPATLKYRHEETLLAKQPDPERFNREMIYPDKVRINKKYIRNHRFADDLRYLWQSLLD